MWWNQMNQKDEGEGEARGLSHKVIYTDDIGEMYTEEAMINITFFETIPSCWEHTKESDVESKRTE